MPSKIPTTHCEAMKDTKGYTVGRGKSWWVKQRTQCCKYASWQSSSKPRSGEGTQTDSGVSMRHSCQKTWESTVKNGRQAKRSQRSSLSLKNNNSKRQDFILYTDGPVTKDQSGWGFTVHCQARCDHHPRRQCSLYGLSFQLGNGDGSSHPCPPLDCLSKEVTVRCHLPPSSQIQWACHKKWNGKPRVKCVNGRHPPSKTPVVVLPWTCRSEGQDRLAGKPASSSGLHLGWSEVFRSSRPYPREQGLGHHTTDRLEERGVCCVLCYC